MSTFMKECVDPPAYYRLYSSNGDGSDHKTQAPAPPLIPDNFEANEAFSKVYPMPTVLNPEITNITSGMSGTQIRARLSQLVNLVVNSSFKPLLNQGERATMAGHDEMKGYLDELFSILHSLRRRQANHQICKEMEEQIAEMKNCEDDLTLALKEAKELMMMKQ
jgi:hypothetical protein